MKSFRLSNEYDYVMEVAFEPGGYVYLLPPKEYLRVEIMDEWEGGGAEDVVVEVLPAADGRVMMAIWVERSEFRAYHNGEQVSVD